MKNIHWTVNKLVGQKCQNHMAALLMAELCEKQKMSKDSDEDGGFPFPSEEIEKSLLITKEMRQKLTQLLEDNGFIKVIKKGLPSRHYYYIQQFDYRDDK